MSEMNDERITPIILCGGAGTRLWPLSRQARPKQMLALTGDETMLRLTARRVARPDRYRPPLIVGAAAQAEAIAAEVPEGRLILEPAARNTAPAIALAALNAARDDVLLVLPSDHLIADPEGFDAAVNRALPFARDGWIVTFGMAPDRPETGYGYIRRGRALGEGIHAVDRFVEKPDRATAQAYLADGSHYWNGGIFLMRADVLIDGLAEHAPAVLAAAQSAVARQRSAGGRILPDAAAFAEAPSLSIDYALMEKARRIAMAPVSIGWSDIGSFEALHQLSAQDEDGNALAGDVIALDTVNCLIRSEGPLVAAVGVSDLVVVARGDAVLILPKAESQRASEIVKLLNARGRTDLV